VNSRSCKEGCTIAQTPIHRSTNLVRSMLDLAAVNAGLRSNSEMQFYSPANVRASCENEHMPMWWDRTPVEIYYYYYYYHHHHHHHYHYVTTKITPWNWVLLELSPVAQLLKNFPIFYGTRRFITVFTRVLTGPYPEPDQSSP
jgi:hypothetical protein